MTDDDYTLTSPLRLNVESGTPLLCLTLVWHPDPIMVGRQFLAPEDSLELSRYSPLFRNHEQEGQYLGSQNISRKPVVLDKVENDSLKISPSDGRMVTEVNGKTLAGSITLSRAELEAGVMLLLGRSVLINLRWIFQLPKHNPVDGFIGVSPVAQKTRDLIRQVAKMDDPVLLLGETGTGKEVAATAIHALSARRDKPLVSVNMAALSESLAAADLFGAGKGAYTGAQSSRSGYFAAAEHATLFLDEIGNTPAPVQPMLLRVLETGDYRPLGGVQDKQSSARLITATDQDLHSENFNQALLRRLESLVIRIPPLRERREDIGLLLLSFLDKHKQLQGAHIQIDPMLVSELAHYDWPGNVRQLAQAFKRLVLFSQMGDQPDFAQLVQARAINNTSTMPLNSVEVDKRIDNEKLIPARKRLADLTEEDVLNAMEDNDWYIQGAAQTLGISRPSMYQLLKIHSMIRKPEAISNAEIYQVVGECKGNIEAAASRLKTPTEALRRLLSARERAK